MESVPLLGAFFLWEGYNDDGKILKKMFDPLSTLWEVVLNGNSMKYVKGILIIVGVIGIALLIVSVYEKYTVKNIDEKNLPKIIQADWIDLNRISHISKFRSGSGHDFSGNGETCRSMKHYFNAIRTDEEEKLVNENKGFPPAFSLEQAIPIYSPVDGEIIAIKGDQSDLGKQVYIRPKKYQNFTIRLFHVFMIDGYTEGRTVSAGEQIANIGRIQNTDIAVSIGGSGSKIFVSYFDVMPDEIFTKYQSVGIESRDQLIITKEYREAHSLKCKGEWFAENHDASGDELVYINGYQRGDW